MIEAVVGVALRAILASVVLGGALAALVFGATRTLALTAATRHALWITALIATAAMPLAGITVSALRATPAIVSSPSHLSAVGHHLPLPPAAPAHAAPRAPGFAFTPHVTRALALAIATAWALGALIGLIGLAASVLRVRGLKRRSSPLGAELAEELPWLTDVGPGREIYLRLSHEIETPVAIGFRRPVILIPTELATAEGLTAIEPLILHEHAHLRRYDDWTNLVQRVIERLFWFNPVVWIVGRRIALEREIASDDAVVEKTGAPTEYANSLWRLAREMRMPEHTVVAPGALLTRKQISVRIEQLLDGNRTRLRRSPAAALGVATAGIVAVALVATSSPAVELPAAPTPHHVIEHPHLVVALLEPAATPLASPSAAPSTTAQPPLSPALEQKIRDARAQALRAQASAHAAALKAHAEAMRGAAASGAASASESVQSTIQHALGSLPREIGQGLEADTPSRQGRLDGTKLSRDAIASCVGCSMRGADARGLDLHGLKISGDDLSGADLRGVNLAGSRLIGTDLAGADLSNADLRNAELSGVDLGQANLAGADLTNARLDGCDLSGADLRGARMTGMVKL